MDSDLRDQLIGIIAGLHAQDAIYWRSKSFIDIPSRDDLRQAATKAIESVPFDIDISKRQRFYKDAVTVRDKYLKESLNG